MRSMPGAQKRVSRNPLEEKRTCGSLTESAGRSFHGPVAGEGKGLTQRRSILLIEFSSREEQGIARGKGFSSSRREGLRGWGGDSVMSLPSWGDFAIFEGTFFKGQKNIGLRQRKGIIVALEEDRISWPIKRKGVGRGAKSGRSLLMGRGVEISRNWGAKQRRGNSTKGCIEKDPLM